MLHKILYSPPFGCFAILAVFVMFAVIIREIVGDRWITAALVALVFVAVLASVRRSKPTEPAAPKNRTAGAVYVNRELGKK